MKIKFKILKIKKKILAKVCKKTVDFFNKKKYKIRLGQTRKLKKIR